jgi:hypothetical protein
VASVAVGDKGLRSRQPSAGDETDEEQRTGAPADVAVRSAPPWLISATVHLLILILLALASVAKDDKPYLSLQAVVADTLGEQLIEDDLQSALLKVPLPETAEPLLSKDLTPAEIPFAAPPNVAIDPSGTAASSDIQAPSIGLALTGREKGAREALLAAYGGNELTEGAVTAGLAWLARQQDTRTGLWSLRGPYANGSMTENRVAATAMALLAFQGNGNTHKAGTHSRFVARGMEALLKNQGPDGDFFPDAEGSFNHPMYSRAIALIAICELYGMTKDAKYRQRAQRALDYAVKSQSPELGGWRYVPCEDSDTSVTGWFVMALQSGLMAGLDVPTPTLDRVRKYLDSATTDGVRYAYRPGAEPSVTMTAEALLCRQYLGWPRDEPRLREGVKYLLANPVTYKDQNTYYWYYATQVLHHMGGKEWDQWNRVMREQVPKQQVKEGKERGSWEPGHDGTWGPMAGRLYTTCLSLYLLEVYYRHLPLYKH